MTTEQIILEDGAGIALAASQLAHLEELRELSMEIARELGRRAADPECDAAQAGMAFERIALTVRRTIALEQEVAGLREQHRRNNLGRIFSDRKGAVKRGVRSAVRSAVLHEEPEIERRELRERLEDLIDREDYRDYDRDDYMRGTVGEVVARICADLGVETDPAIWDDAGYSLNDSVTPDPDPPNPGLPDPSHRSRRKSSRSRPTANGPPTG